MENSRAVLEKKLDDSVYSRDKYLNNFAAESELTVTITLEEYRDLVKENATASARIDEAEKNKWERESKITKLKTELENLKSLLKSMSNKDDQGEPNVQEELSGQEE